MANPSSYHPSPCNPPLTWREARYRLRSFLAQYASETPPTEVKQRAPVLHEDTRNGACANLLAWWLYWDLDVYFATGSAFANLIIAAMSHTRGSFRSSDDARDELLDDYLQSQLTAGVLVFLGGIINLWLIGRRRHSNRRGVGSLKRREIGRFLKEIEKQEEERLRQQDCTENLNTQEHPLELDGTSLAGVYPVYRRKFRYGGKSEPGSWCRIPTLLLVKGDHIALQVGDVTPAACKLIETHRIPVQLQEGELITLATFQETSTLAAAKWPRGRTTLPKDSEKLLTLCNNMRIFEVLETPLEGFLNQSPGENCCGFSFRGAGSA